MLVLSSSCAGIVKRRYRMYNYQTEGMLIILCTIILFFSLVKGREMSKKCLTCYAVFLYCWEQ